MSELTLQGISLMAMGMGTVFVFLAVLVVGTLLMSYTLARMPGATLQESGAVSAQPTAEDFATIAAVAAAVSLIHTQ